MIMMNRNHRQVKYYKRAIFKISTVRFINDEVKQQLFCKVIKCKRSRLEVDITKFLRYLHQTAFFGKNVTRTRGYQRMELS